MPTPIGTAVIRVAAVKAGRQNLRQVMADLHRALRHRGVKGRIFDSYLLLPTGPDPVTGLVKYNEPCWKITACGENYDNAGLA